MSEELTKDQISQVLNGISIPPQPQIMVDLQMEQMDPNFSLENIADLISQDVGLAGSILKTVNSTFYGLSNKITSIKQAVNLLGLKSVINLVNALSIRGELSDEEIIAMGKFWDSAMEIAQTASVIAKQIGYGQTDEAYTLGLFHNCGVPLLMMKQKDYVRVMLEAYAQPDQSITDAENAIFNTNHAVVGYYIAKSWNLPSYLCDAIHQHHNAEKVMTGNDPDNRKKTLLAVLKMAEHICGNCRIIGNQDQDYEWNRIEEHILMYVGLTQYDFGNLKQQIYDMGISTGSYYG